MQEKQLKEPNEAARHVKSLLFARPAIMIRLLISGIVQQSSSVWRTHKRISPLSTDKSKSLGGTDKTKSFSCRFPRKTSRSEFLCGCNGSLHSHQKRRLSIFKGFSLFIFFLRRSYEELTWALRLVPYYLLSCFSLFNWLLAS